MLRTALIAVSTLASFACAAPQPDSDTPNVVPAPPRTEPKEIAALIDQAASDLAAKRRDASQLLTDRALLAAHEFPRFREIIKANAPFGAVTMAGPEELGTRLVARCRVIDADGKPIPDALVYAYHTDAKGWYSHRGPHVGGGEDGGGDVGHARLFAYIRTDAEGRFELRTIRPAGYPRSTLPQHIHLHFEADGYRRLAWEILFDDDPRLSRAQRELEGGYPICKPQKQPDGADLVTADFTLKKR